MSLTEIEKSGQRGNLWEKNAFSFIHVDSETEYANRVVQKGWLWHKSGRGWKLAMRI